MVLTGPGDFELRPDINPIKVLLVHNILNSIIYFSLVCQDKIGFILLDILYRPIQLY